MLSTIGTSAIADGSETTYLNCVSDYAKITDNYVASNYNVRTRKFLNYYEITGYSENFISFKKNAYTNFKLNKNNGNWFSGGSALKICKKTTINDPSTLNSRGKLF